MNLWKQENTRAKPKGLRASIGKSAKCTQDFERVLTEITEIEGPLGFGAESMERLQPCSRGRLDFRIVGINATRPRPASECVWKSERSSWRQMHVGCGIVT